MTYLQGHTNYSYIFSSGVNKVQATHLLLTKIENVNCVFIYPNYLGEFP
jgi:hypothetical protein